MSYGITTNGFVRKPKDIIRSEKVILARSKFGEDVDFSPYSFEGQWIDVMTENENDLWEKLETQYYNVYIQSAIGVQLDRIAGYNGISRRPAIKASVSLSFTGTDTTVIPIVFACQTANGIVFNTTEEVTITDGVAIANAEANLAGIGGIVSENSIVEIINPLAGLDTVNNDLPSFGGLPIESDLDLRTRILSLGISGKSSVSAIKKRNRFNFRSFKF